jgi:hypothetical protein
MCHHHIRSELVGYKLDLPSTGSAGQVQHGYGDSRLQAQIGPLAYSWVMGAHGIPPVH